MSKQIVLSGSLCALLGACALNVFPVVAEVPRGQEPGIHRAADPAMALAHSHQDLEADGQVIPDQRPSPIRAGWPIHRER
ncbi:MAG: hypothetical protein U5O69_06070 [Candidatus Competibacteraceae bacterium]|nr:hypothetical protein [Candidatus Competibacteraceae bacterium]